MKDLAPGPNRCDASVDRWAFRPGDPLLGLQVPPGIVAWHKPSVAHVFEPLKSPQRWFKRSRLPKLERRWIQSIVEC